MIRYACAATERQELLNLYIKNRTAGSNQGAALFFPLVAGMVDVADIATGVKARASAFGVFCWLEVMDLDLFFGFLLFLCFVLHITFQLFVVCVVSLTPNN